MKHLSLLLVGASLGVVLGAARPVAAQEHEQHHTDVAPAPVPTTTTPHHFDAIQKTWDEVRRQTKELDALIVKRAFSEVHDAALNLRDTVRELRFGWDALPADRKARADAGIRKIDGLLDSLHESADNNDPKGVANDQRTLHVLLDNIAGAFPSDLLPKVGPLTAKGTVRDPYCRMAVDPATAAASVVTGGQTYYFCSKSEAEDFKKNPAPYIALYDELAFGKAKAYTVGIGTPGKIQPNSLATLAFSIREQGKRDLTTKFQLVHEKLMHLIVVSDDLSWFAHEHPQIAKDGRFYIEQRFPRDGRYFLYTDFTPADGTNQVLSGEVRVGSGVTRAPQKLVPDTKLSRTVDGVKVDLKLSSPLQAGKQALLTYTLSKDGQPVQNMTPYLAAMGHMMAVSQSGKDVVHTHAVSAGTDPMTGLSVTSQMSTPTGPTQTFKLELPSSGFYKVWAQFGVNGRTLTVPFVFQVQKNPNMKPHTILRPVAVLAAGTAMIGAAKAAPSTAQKVTITLPQGYKSGVATVKAGKPVTLTFVLKSDAGCGNTVSVPAAKWSKTLKVGERATVTYTPKKSGTLAFQCSMNMYKGTVTVK